MNLKHIKMGYLKHLSYRVGLLTQKIPVFIKLAYFNDRRHVLEKKIQN